MNKPCIYEVGWAQLLSGSNLWRSLALAGGVALHAINVYLATTILPSVVRDIGGLDFYAWNTTVFVVASILGSALSAKLLHLARPRGAYATAAAVFGLGTLICAFAPNMAVMLSGRFVQGFGGGLLFALSYAMIQIVFAEALWPRAMALISGMWGVATLVGPAVGGMFAEFDAWRAAFWSLLPVTAAFAALAIAVLPKHTEACNKTKALPIVQLFLLALAALAISAGSVTPKPLWNLSGVVAAVGLIGALIVAEKNSKRTLLPHGALQLTTPLGALYVTMSLLVIGMTGETFVPYFLQTLHGESPLVAGYLGALMAAGWTVASLLSSGWAKTGARRAIISGPLLVLLGLIVLAILTSVGSSATNWTVLAPICFGLILVGFGIGIGWPHLLTRVLQVAPEAEKDSAAASITTVQLFATALGAAITGMVANLAGLTVPGGEAGAANAARWLFVTLAFAPVFCFPSALRIARDLRAVRFTPGRLSAS